MIFQVCIFWSFKNLPSTTHNYHLIFLLQKTGNSPNREQIQNFVETNFHDEGSEFEIWEPNDWNEHISLFDNISVMYRHSSDLSIVRDFYFSFRTTFLFLLIY